MREARRSWGRSVVAAEGSGVVDGRVVVRGGRDLDGVDELSANGDFAAGLGEFGGIGGEVGEDWE